MKKIKLRAWDVNEKTMITDVFTRGIDVELNEDSELYAWNHDSFGDYYEYDLMLSSGLVDKNHDEIYERDIIRFKYEDKCEEKGYGYCEGIVVFKNGCFVVEQAGFDYRPGYEPMTLHTWLKDNPCEIVGNIYRDF